MFITEYLKTNYTLDKLEELHSKIVNKTGNRDSEVYVVLDEINKKIKTGKIFTGSESLTLYELDMLILSSKEEVVQESRDRIMLQLCESYTLDELRDLYRKCDEGLDVRNEIKNLTESINKINKRIKIDLNEFKYSLQDAIEYKEILLSNESIDKLNSFNR